MSTGRHVRVSGRVQGVFFRQWTKQHADALGVTGWVHNCRDGSVEAHVEGDEGAVGWLIEAMRSGPSGAGVDDLTFENATVEQFNTFEARS